MVRIFVLYFFPKEGIAKLPFGVWTHGQVMFAKKA